MSERFYRDVRGDEIVLADGARATILAKHHEVTLFIDGLDRVLSDPDEIRRSVRDERVVLYYQYRADVLNGKWVVAVVKRVDRHFVSTLYVTDRIKSGERLWKKSE